MDGSDLQNSHIHHIPFHPVGTDLGNPVPWFNAQSKEAITDVVDDFSVFFDADLLPLTIFLGCDHIILWFELLLIIRKEVKNACYFHTKRFMWWLFPRLLVQY